MEESTFRHSAPEAGTAEQDELAGGGGRAVARETVAASSGLSSGKHGGPEAGTAEPDKLAFEGDPGATRATIAASGGLSSATRTGDKPRSRAPQLPRGTVVGRYMVLDALGEGGMGVVYKAYDPELDRSVALKVVALDRDVEDASVARARMVREAQALAQLDHPNVVAVHDVGAFGDDVFIAMGLVEGQTLRAWLRAKKRTPAEVLPVFIAAGRGLSAAHRAGLVHRDFKPDNVLIGNDGRIQVVDFGLACGTDQPLAAPSRGDRGNGATGSSSGLGSGDSLATPLTESSRRSVTALRSHLTRAGSMMGTPVYMSPEQLLCEAVDHRTDQFSFCVALYEGLYGQRPFTGRTVQQLKLNVLRSKLPPPPTESRVPARLRRIVVRGLSIDPDARYASMDELLVELARDPAARLRRAALMVAGAVVAGLAVAALARSGAEPTLCRGAEGELQGVWDAKTRASARAAFLATGIGYAEETFGRVEQALDAYAEGWVAMRTAACRATHIAGTQSERLLDLRMSCLDRRRGELGALAAIFTSDPNPATIENALPAALALPPIDTCADEYLLTAAVPPPADPAARRAVDGAREQLAGARALEATAHYAKGLETLEPVRATVAKLDYDPLTAELALLTGVLRLGAGESAAAEAEFRRAMVTGSRARDDGLVADSWIMLLRTLNHEARYAAAIDLATGAEAAVARGGGDPARRGRLLQSLGALHYLQGNYTEAIEAHEAGLSVLREALGDSHPDVAASLNALGNIYYTQGKYALARELYERTLAIRERAFGGEHPAVAEAVYNLAMLAYNEPDYERCEAMFRRCLTLFVNAYGDEHPTTAAAYYGLGVLYAQIARHTEAESLLRRSLQIRERVLGPDHPLTGSSLSMLGVALNSMERYDEARQYQQRALTIWEAKLGPQHPKLAYALNNLGLGASMQGRHAEALAYYDRAIAIRTAASGEQHDEVARGHVYYADALARQGKLRDALARYEHALAIYAKVFGDDHPEMMTALAGKGACLVRLGRDADARPPLERAVALPSRHGGVDGYIVAQAEFDLARALWNLGVDHEVARSHAERARDVFATDARPSASEHLAAAAAWLREHAAHR